MAAPATQTRNSGASAAADTTTHSINLPSGINPGETLIVIFSVDEAPTCTATGGWWKLGQASNSTVVTSAVFWKVAEGSDNCTITTSTAQQSSHVSLRISGGGSVTGTSANGNSTNSNPPLHTPPVGSKDYLWIATRSGDSTVVATVAPTNYGNLQTQAAAGTGGASTNTAERTLTASSENPGTFTSATEQWVSWTISVAPNNALLETLTDNANDNSLNATLWGSDTVGTGTFNETNQRFEIGLSASGDSATLFSNAEYSLMESYGAVKLTTAGSENEPTFGLGPYIWQFDDDTNAVYWNVGSDGAGTRTLLAIYRIAGVETEVRNDTTYDPLTHLNFRCRVANPNLYWEYWNGSSWQEYTHESIYVMFPLTSMAAGLQAAYYDVPGGSTTWAYDDFNVLPTAATDTPQRMLTGMGT